MAKQRAREKCLIIRHVTTKQHFGWQISLHALFFVFSSYYQVPVEMALFANLKFENRRIIIHLALIHGLTDASKTFIRFTSFRLQASCSCNSNSPFGCFHFKLSLNAVADTFVWFAANDLTSNQLQLPLIDHFCIPFFFFGCTYRKRSEWCAQVKSFINFRS